MDLADPQKKSISIVCDSRIPLLVEASESGVCNPEISS